MQVTEVNPLGRTQNPHNPQNSPQLRDIEDIGDSESRSIPQEKEEASWVK